MKTSKLMESIDKDALREDGILRLPDWCRSCKLCGKFYNTVHCGLCVPCRDELKGETP